MYYNSISEICEEFDISSNQSIPDIISELRKLISAYHPDHNPNGTEEDLEKFYRLVSAKEFLSQLDRRTMVPVEDIIEIVDAIKHRESTLLEKEEKLQHNINITFQKIEKNVKNYYLPFKITVASVAGIVSFIWAFPSILTEHPIINKIGVCIGDSIYFLLTVIWVCLLVLSLCVFFIVCQKEMRIKCILSYFDNADNQYYIFTEFIEQINTNKKSFTSKKLEEYICEKIYKSQYLEGRYRLRTIIPKRLFSQIKEIAPRISEMIILRALEKGLIIKENKQGWYDSYIVEQLELG